MNIPSEIELISFFECEPEMLDKVQQVPFFYNQATYVIKNKYNEKFIFSVSPSYGIVKAQVFDENSGESIAELDFSNVASIEILEDDKSKSKLLLKSKNLVVKIQMKPKFQIFLLESFEP